MKLREEEFYEQYHHHGGTTIIPTEIFNELYDDATEEIERLNNIINNFEKWLEEYISLLKEPDIYEEQTLEDLKEVLDKLQKLKGSDKE